MTEENKMPEQIWAWMGLQENGSWDRDRTAAADGIRYIRADTIDDASILVKFLRDVQEMLYPDGIKHPQQAKPEWLLKELRKQLRHLALDDLVKEGKELGFL